MAEAMLKESQAVSLVAYHRTNDMETSQKEIINDFVHSMQTSKNSEDIISIHLIIV